LGRGDLMDCLRKDLREFEEEGTENVTQAEGGRKFRNVE